jgi:hypothetical protein
MRLLSLELSDFRAFHGIHQLAFESPRVSWRPVGLSQTSTVGF